MPRGLARWRRVGEPQAAPAVSPHRVEITAALASQWLRYRHQRWPGSRNPHLLVNQQTAADTSPVGPTVVGAMFERQSVIPG
jgi:hypothetical protein